jgi:hypothetical protein
MQEKIEELISQGQQFTFGNNCYRSETGIYSRASPQLLAWIATVEDFVIENFGIESAPYRLYKKFDDRFLNGYEKNSFDWQHNVLIAALTSCARISPKVVKKDIAKDALLNIVFERFHVLVIQLRKRHSGRGTLDVQDEYDVQDLLHGILKLFYDDIRKEEWTPSYAGGSSRMDFLLKEEQVVIEVKMTREGLSDKELGKQLIEDKARYKAHPDCKRLICFTYDPDGRVVNPKGIQNDLNQDQEDFVVEVVIKPSY